MPPPADASVEQLLTRAADLSAKHDWKSAANLYEMILTQLGKARDPPEMARVTELLAMSYFKTAFQAYTREEFNRSMDSAKSVYEETQQLYRTANSKALTKKAQARANFASFWLTESPTDKRTLIAKCIDTVEEALLLLEKGRDDHSLAEAHKDLLYFLTEYTYLASDGETLRVSLDRAAEIGERAIAEFDRLNDPESLVEVLYRTIFLLIELGVFVLEPERYERSARRAEDLGRKLIDVSGKLDSAYTCVLASEAAGWLAANLEGDNVKAMGLFEEAIIFSEKVRDSYTSGRALGAALYVAYWTMWGIEVDADRRTEFFKKGLEYAQEAAESLEIPMHGAWLQAVYSWYADSYTQFAVFVETKVEKKREHMQEAVRIARKGYAYKDYSLWWNDIGHALSKALYFSAILEKPSEEKSKLLSEALTIREETVGFLDKLSPASWDSGVELNYLALIKAELSGLKPDHASKSELLRGAVSTMQQCVEQCGKWATVPARMRVLAQYVEWYGDTLLQLHQLTRDTESVNRAIKAYSDAIGYMARLDRQAPIAAIRWKIAKAHDLLGDYGEASRKFIQAAEDYRRGAKQIPAVTGLFEQMASYMAAWASIEDARVSHDRQEYSFASENYSKAAHFLASTPSWCHLSKHYAACALLEKGEELSRAEKIEESISSFSAAVEDFQAADSQLHEKLTSSLGLKEEEEVKDWLKITEGRKRYCLSRIKLEDAKSLDKKGEESSSARMYLSASEAFKELVSEVPNEQGRRELETFAVFCEAWAKMKEAEVAASPELYAEASLLFMKAKDVAAQKSRLIALANASLCRALESGARFRYTRDSQLYSEIKKQLETTGDYYRDAGLKNGAEWTKATQRLFDALVYLTEAEAERQREKKTELYHLAEKHLELAAKLYEQAGFESKREEAVHYLQKAREEKELLLTPIQALTENPAVSGAALTPVTLTSDQARGLERFEAASIVGNLSIEPRELSVRSNLALELEIVNVGKTPATLIKLENIVPEGFELEHEKISYHVEDGFISMKGKRLEHLKTDEIKITLKALRKGSFDLRPRILFVDEKGTYQAYDFEAVTITVRELGISGWIKGSGR